MESLYGCDLDAENNQMDVPPELRNAVDRMMATQGDPNAGRCCEYITDGGERINGTCFTYDASQPSLDDGSSEARMPRLVRILTADGTMRTLNLDCGSFIFTDTHNSKSISCRGDLRYSSTTLKVMELIKDADIKELVDVMSVVKNEIEK